MKHLCITVAALALAGCRTQPTGDHATGTARPGGGAERAPEITAPMPPVSSAPYSGYPGPVAPLDAGTARGDAGVRAADAGPPPPSTSMPAPRPVYPDAGR